MSSAVVSEPVAVSTAEATQTVPQMIEQLITLSTQLASSHKAVIKTLTTLQRQWEREQKRTHRTKARREVKQKPTQVNKAMRDFMVKNAGAVAGTEAFTRSQMMKALSEYIKGHSLASATNKKEWTPDATLTKLLGLEKGKTFTYMNLNGLITRVVEKPSA